MIPERQNIYAGGLEDGGGAHRNERREKFSSLREDLRLAERRLKSYRANIIYPGINEDFKKRLLKEIEELDRFVNKAQSVFNKPQTVRIEQIEILLEQAKTFNFDQAD